MPPSLRKRERINLDERGDDTEESESDAEDPQLDADEQEDGPSKPGIRPTPGKKGVKAQKAVAKSTARGSRKRAALPEDVSILEVVQHHGGAIPALAKSWVHDYEQDRAHAVAALLTFFIQACGCGYEVSDEEVEEGEVDKLVQGVLRLAAEKGIEDHFTARGKVGGKAFRAHFLELWDHFVREAAASEVLFDGFVLGKVLDLAMAMSCATVRSFRLVATTAAMQLVTSMIRVISTLTDARDTAQRQLEAEQKRKGNKAAAERASSLRHTINQAHHRATELKDHIKVVFDAVAAHRFRDISEEVRSVVIVGIGQWIDLMPSMFLQDAYLKYVAWALSDKDAVVRQAAVTALLALYSVDDNISPLHAFTARFSTRFAELVYDVDEGVAVQGIHLMTRLAKMEEVDGTAVRDTYRLLVDDAAPIRHAAAELVADLLPDLGERQLQPAKQGKRRGSAPKPSEAQLQLSGLLYIMYLLANDEEDDEDAPERRRMSVDGQHAQEKPLAPEMVNHVVDALFDRVELLTDWRTLAGALEDEEAGAERLSHAAITNLLQLLTASVHKACGGTLVAARQDSRKGTGKAHKAAVEERRQSATLLFMKTLPGLLRKYQTDPVQAAALAGIVTDLQLEVFSLRKAETALEGLLAQVADTFEKHVARPTLDACVHALVHGTTDGSDTTKEHARLVLDSMADTIAKRLADGVEAVEQSSDSQLACSLDAAASSQEDTGGDGANVGFAVAAALQRADRLQLQSGALATSEPFYNAITRILQAAADGRELGQDIIGGAARNAFMLLLWRMNGLDQEDPDVRELRALAEARQRLTALLEATLEASQQDTVREAVFLVLGDLYLVFGAPSLGDGNLAALHAPPSAAALRQLWAVCEDVLDQQVQMPASESQDEDVDDAVQEALEALDTQKERAVMVVGRLAVFGAAGPQQPWLAARLLSHYVAHGARVEAAIKDIARQLKKVDADALPQRYAEALQVAFKRVSQYDGPEEDFLALADRIAASYAGFNASAGACDAICRAGTAFALKDAPANLAFFLGLKHFVTKLPAERATTFAAELEEAAANASTDDSADEWQPYLVVLDLLRDRGAKGKTPRGALRKTGGRGGRSTAKASAKRSGRRISFAEEDTQDEEASDDADEPEEEVREEDIPARRPQRRPQDEIEDIIEEPEPLEDLRAASESELPVASPIIATEEALPGTERRNHTRAGPRSDSGIGAADDADEDEGNDRLPTEEQLPPSVKRGRPKKSPKRKRPTMTKLYAASDDEKSGGDGDDNASEDGLLRADEVPGGSPAAAGVASPPRRRRRRLTAMQETDGDGNVDVSPTQDEPPPRPGFGRRRR